MWQVTSALPYLPGNSLTGPPYPMTAPQSSSGPSQYLQALKRKGSEPNQQEQTAYQIAVIGASCQHCPDLIDNDKAKAISANQQE